MPRRIEGVYQRRSVLESAAERGGGDGTLQEIESRLQQIRLSLDGPDYNGPKTRFDDMGLKPKLLQGIYSYGLEKPAKIQELAIMPGIHGKDLIFQAQSGMGKTAAMAIILLERINPRNPACQAMVLVHTRELAEQIHEVISKIGQYMGIKSMVCIGGKGNAKQQNAELANGGTHVIVGSLGRLRNMLSDSIVDPLELNMFAVDEADRLLVDGSFRKDVRSIFSTINGRAQIILMSATMPERALAYAGQVTRNATKFLLNAFDLTLEGIRQYHVDVGMDDVSKLDTLCELLPMFDTKHVLVFCNTRLKVSQLFNQLIDRGLTLGCIDGKKPQGERSAVLQRFKTSETRVLITSDLLGRGIDVQQVFAVIQYDFPSKTEEYIHRVGRAGRHGRKGIAITLVNEIQKALLEKLETFYDTQIPEMPTNISHLIL